MGTFFVLVGLALLILFITSAITRQANGIYLLVSLAALLIGLALRRNKPVNDSGRFGAIRRANARGRQRREEKKKPPEKK